MDEIQRYIEAVIYIWPFSQICHGCEFGDVITCDALNDGSAICNEGCKDNNGKECPMYADVDKEAEWLNEEEE